MPDQSTTMPPTPELDKQLLIINSGQAGAVQQFIDWLGPNGYVIAKRCTDPIHDRLDLTCGACEGTELLHAHLDYESMMAGAFGIDRDKIEQERRALLDALRASHD